MRYASYLLVMILILGLSSLFFLKRPDGKPWLSMDNIFNTVQIKTDQAITHSKRTLDKAIDYSQDVISNDLEKTGEAVYKWQDSQGNWIYSDKPNLNGQSQVHDLDPNKITILPAEDTTILKQLAEKKANTDKQLSAPSALNPSEVKKLMKDAKNIQKLMDERTNKLDKALEKGQ